jgi:hypothetical protein
MAILKLYRDSRNYGTCRSCGASIEWADLVSGRRMPFDPPIVPVRTQGSLLDGDRIVEDVDTTITRSHFATCPDAKAWRRV